MTPSESGTHRIDIADRLLDDLGARPGPRKCSAPATSSDRLSIIRAARAELRWRGYQSERQFGLSLRFSNTHVRDMLSGKRAVSDEAMQRLLHTHAHRMTRPLVNAIRAELDLELLSEAG